MLADPVFSLAAASPEQLVAFIGFARIHDRFLRLGRLPGSYEIAAAEQRARRNAAG